jgi:hypothetical protein
MPFKAWTTKLQAVVQPLSRKSGPNSNLVETTSGTLPIEVWARIAFYACSHGGRISTTLSLVCKNASAGTRWHALDILTVYSRERLRKLVHTMQEKRTQHHTFHVQHLLVYIEFLEQLELLSQDSSPLYNYTTPLSNLLSSESRHLRSLVLLIERDLHISRFRLSPFTNFPQLQTMSLSMNAVHAMSIHRAPLGQIDPTSFALTSAPKPISPVFPVLVSLHVAFDSWLNETQCSIAVENISQFTRMEYSPQLAHLIISCVPRHEIPVGMIASLIRTQETRDRRSPFIGSHVHEITIVPEPRRDLQPSQAATSGAGSATHATPTTSVASATSLMQRLRTRASASDRRPPRDAPVRTLTVAKIRLLLASACDKYECDLDPLLCHHAQRRRVAVVDLDIPHYLDQPYITSFDAELNIEYYRATTAEHVFCLTDSSRTGPPQWPDTLAGAQCDYLIWKTHFLQNT